MNSFIQQAPEVFLLKVPMGGIWTGVYLVKDGDNAFLIDSGPDAQSVDNVIVPALAELGLAPKDITCLLATHTHGDHVGGHYRLRELGIKAIACLRHSAEKIRDPLKYAKLIRAKFPQDSPPASSSLRGVEPDFTLEDEESIGPIQFFHAPGHDDDTAVILHTPSKALLTGDSFQADGTTVQGCALYMKLPEYRRTLGRIASLKPSAIIPGHDFIPFNADFPNTTGKAAAAIEITKNLLGTYEAFIIAQMQTGCDDQKEIAKNLIRFRGGTIPEFLFLALYTTTEHIQEIKSYNLIPEQE